MKYQEWLNGCGCCPDIQDCPPSTGNPCDCDSILLELSKQHTDDLVLQDEIDNLDEKKLDASAYTPVDLTDYYTKEEVDELIPSLDGYATEEWVNEQGFLKTVEPLKTINGETLIGEGDIVISGGSGDAYTKEETDALLNDKQDTLTSGENIKTINNISILGSGNIEISGGSESKAIVAGRGIKVTSGETADTVAFDMPITDTNPSLPYFNSGYIKVGKPLAIGNGSLATMPTNGKFAVSQNNGDVSYATDFSVSGDGRIFIDDYHSKGHYGVRSTYCLQDKLDSLQPILSAGTGIDITDNVISATGGGGVTSGEVQTMIDESISGKQDTLTSGENIKTINNVSILGSGNIDVQSLTNVPVYSGSALASVSINNPSGLDNGYNRISGYTSVGAGYMVETRNADEAAFGAYNLSNGENSEVFNYDSGSTLFSVGNGHPHNTGGYIRRHNAFEIRQNGDIYYTDTNAETEFPYEQPMIKLQDVIKNLQNEINSLKAQINGN